MKIRKVNLAIASALMMAGSAAAIAPASAATDATQPHRILVEHGRKIEREFSAHWKEGVEWCVSQFGETQRNLCGYHTALVLNSYIYHGRGDAARIEFFEKAANEAWEDLVKTKG